MRELSRLFKALGDETRLRILKLLEVMELCVCEVEQSLQIAQSRASRHLGILREAGLVTDRREGPWVVYQLRDDAPAKVAGALGEDVTGLDSREAAHRCVEAVEKLLLDLQLPTLCELGVRAADTASIVESAELDYWNMIARGPRVADTQDLISILEEALSR